VTSFNAEFFAFLRTIGPASRLRMAPTPSGFLHAGNAVNFVLNWLAARHTPGARLLLRIDDLDADRKRAEYVQDVFDTLYWLGLDWDEGPRDALDFEQHWSQHTRLALYHSALDALKARDHLFACAKSRRDLEPFPGLYPPAFRNQHCSLVDPEVAWRIRTPDDFILPDFVVRRRDRLPAYQIASLADDRFFRMTHIVRGQDLADSTTAQRYLAVCLDWTDFARVQILHHPLLLNDSGEKLSKSAGATALRAWREEGRSPDVIFQQVAGLLRLDTSEVLTAEGLLRAFQTTGLG